MSGVGGLSGQATWAAGHAKYASHDSSYPRPPRMNFDPRITPARPDLAARHLEGTVEAARFVDGRAFAVVDAVAPMRRAPSPDATQVTEALMGERVTVYET